MSVGAAEARGGRARKGRGSAGPARPGRRVAMRAAGPAPGGGPGSAPAARRGRGSRRARPSFVDESLFGSPAGARPAPPGFAPPWAVAAPPGSGGPRPRSKCRLRSHTPSFCDESLFGAKPQGPARAVPWLRKEDVAKLHPLLWSPPPAPRSQPGLAPRRRAAPLRAVHPPAPESPAPAGAGAGCKGRSCAWERPESHLGSEGWGARRRGCSQSLSRLNTPSDGLCPGSDNPRTERCKNQSPVTAPATPRGCVTRGRSQSTSRLSLARCSMAAGGCKPQPPWK
ncbi:LOW QUALITY PROTEIN: RBPJ-interacting and tubulin-associated protein 1 [Porphyrio hochstetteri]